jgi:hypothetical protein
VVLVVFTQLIRLFLILVIGVFMAVKLVATAFTTLVLTLATQQALAAEVCTVSMMGRVCYEEGSPEATAAHMKGNAVADAAAKKKTDVADASKETKKLAGK